MKTVIIKYNAGNVQSVQFALERIGVTGIITDDADLIKTADRVIFPGVGEASSAMEYLKDKKLDQLIINLEQPVLGICLGMQLMCTSSSEGNVDCLNIFDTPVKHFSEMECQNKQELKIPQVGWNKVYEMESPLFKEIANESYFYFVHSFYADICDATIGKTTYIQPYSVALNYKNFYGVQFHPEKSSTHGEQLLRNFLTL